MENRSFRSLTFAVLLCQSLYASANEQAFKRCVTMKDITLAIAEQADRGVSRASLKARMSDSSIHGLIDFVYDFRGVKSNQEIAANQMENCLRLLGVRPGGR